MMLRRIWTIAWKEFLHLSKDKVLVPFFLLGALAELTLIGWATGQPIDDIHMTVVDNDGSEQSAALVEALDETEALDKQATAEDKDAVYRMMDEDQTVVGLVIPEGYGEAVQAKERPSVELILNGAHWLGATTADYTAQETILKEGMRQAFGMSPEDYEDELPEITVKYNEDLDRAWYTLPAEMGFMFYMMTLILAAIGIVRERERGTYEQLLVMPYRSWEVIIGKTLAPVAVGYGLFIALLLVTTLVFGVPVRGSLALLLVLAVVYIAAEVGKGILLSMVTRTQLQAVLLAVVIAMIDMIFSGYAVAVETMPQVVQKLANFFAIRHWLVVMRGIMLKGVGLEVLWPQMAAIVAIGVVIISVTAWQYRRALG